MRELLVGLVLLSERLLGHTADCPHDKLRVAVPKAVYNSLCSVGARVCLDNQSILQQKNSRVAGCSDMGRREIDEA